MAKKYIQKMLGIEDENICNCLFKWRVIEDEAVWCGKISWFSGLECRLGSTPSSPLESGWL